MLSSRCCNLLLGSYSFQSSSKNVSKHVSLSKWNRFSLISSESRSKSSKQIFNRFYSAVAAPKTVQEWNIELNRLWKLKRYEEASTKYAQMKQEGVEPNNVTYAIMFNNYGYNMDPNGVNSIFDEAKAKGTKGFILQHDQDSIEKIGALERKVRDKALEKKWKMTRVRRANINIFEPLP